MGTMGPIGALVPWGHNFRYYLLDAEYGYSSNNIATTPIKELMGKLVIFASKGYENSSLEELVNYSWEDKIRLIDNF